MDFVGVSDSIAAYILAKLYENEGAAEFSRGEIAKTFACVPSQINYVLATRFSPEHGYEVESRRGGGGFIRIRRVSLSGGNPLMHVINSIGTAIDPASVRAILSNLVEAGWLPRKDALLILAATSPASLTAAPPEKRDLLRAAILKQCLLRTI